LPGTQQEDPADLLRRRLIFTMAWTLRATPSLRIPSAGRKAQSASQPADSADNPAGKLRLPPALLLIRSVRRKKRSAQLGFSLKIEILCPWHDSKLVM
jgi:hypothetical protein